MFFKNIIEFVKKNPLASVGIVAAGGLGAATGVVGLLAAELAPVVIPSLVFAAVSFRRD